MNHLSLLRFSKIFLLFCFVSSLVTAYTTTILAQTKSSSSTTTSTSTSSTQTSSPPQVCASSTIASSLIDLRVSSTPFTQNGQKFVCAYDGSKRIISKVNLASGSSEASYSVELEKTQTNENTKAFVEVFRRGAKGEIAEAQMDVEFRTSNNNNNTDQQIFCVLLLSPIRNGVARGSQQPSHHTTHVVDITNFNLDDTSTTTSPLTVPGTIITINSGNFDLHESAWLLPVGGTVIAAFIPKAAAVTDPPLPAQNCLLCHPAGASDWGDLPSDFKPYTSANEWCTLIDIACGDAQQNVASFGNTLLIAQDGGSSNSEGIRAFIATVVRTVSVFKISRDDTVAIVGMQNDLTSQRPVIPETETIDTLQVTGVEVNVAAPDSFEWLIFAKRRVSKSAHFIYKSPINIPSTKGATTASLAPFVSVGSIRARSVNSNLRAIDGFNTVAEYGIFDDATTGKKFPQISTSKLDQLDEASSSSLTTTTTCVSGSPLPSLVPMYFQFPLLPATVTSLRDVVMLLMEVSFLLLLRASLFLLLIKSSTLLLLSTTTFPILIISLLQPTSLE
jgi:hypothetical protein